MIRWLLALALLIVGCERSAEPPGKSVTLPAKQVVQLEPIMQLPPNRNTHVAVDFLGNIFYTIETDNQQDGVLVVGPSGIPRATQLTSANILAALGQTAGGSGTIQSIVPGPEGRLLFAFIGGKGRAVHACIGQFHLRKESIHILFGTQRLKTISGFGDSIGLARATLVPVGSRIYLLLRHIDAWVLFRFDTAAIAQGFEPELRHACEKIHADEMEIDLTDERYELSPGPGENLLLVDRTSGPMWQVDPASGAGTLRMLLSGLPRELSAPVVVQKDHLLFFAADSEPIEADVSQVLHSRLPRATYPALLEIVGKDITAIGREDLRVYGGFPVYAMRIRQLAPAPDGSFVAYDSSSGMLMRIRQTSAQ